jgi:hypothetical protein
MHRRLAVLLLGVLIAGCGGAAPLSSNAAATLAASGSTASAAPTASNPSATTPPSTGGPGASGGASAEPSISPGWRTVIDTAMVYAGFGIAGNGDVIAIAAPAGAPAGKQYEILRADPASGAILSRVALDKRVDMNSGLPFHIDPTTDNVIGFVGTGTGLALLRLDSKTGGVVTQTKPAVSINLVAVDRQGRVYANSVPFPGTKDLPELLVRLGPDGKVAGKLDVAVTHRDQLDDPGKLAFGYFNFKRIVTYYGWTLALAVSPNGTIQSLQIPGSVGQSEPADQPYFDTFLPDFSHLRRATLPLEWPGGSPRWVFWESILLAMAADDDGRIYLVEAVGPASGNELEWDGQTRLRAVGSDGEVLATWGAGESDAGLGYPQRVAIDDSGRVWVVDQDPTTERQSVKVLEGGAP